MESFPVSTKVKKVLGQELDTITATSKELICNVRRMESSNYSGDK